MKRLVLLAVLAVASRAHAEPDAKVVYAEGEKLYAAGRYLDAAESFRAAYEIDPDPAYLFNVAQAYRFGEDCAKSADFYHRFLAKVPSPPNAAKIAAWAEEQDACAERLAATRPAAVPVIVPARHGAPAPLGHGRLYAGIATAVAGFAIAGLGAYEFTKLGGIVERRTTATGVCTTAHQCSVAEYDAIVKPYDDLASAKQRNGAIGLGVGGLAVATAIYLIATSFGDGEHPPVGVTATTTTAIIMRLEPARAMVYGTWTF